MSSSKKYVPFFMPHSKKKEVRRAGIEPAEAKNCGFQSGAQTITPRKTKKKSV